MKNCNVCKESFENHAKYVNHIRWKHTDVNLGNFSNGAKKGNETRFGKWIVENIICNNQKCNNSFEIKYREKI